MISFFQFLVAASVTADAAVTADSDADGVINEMDICPSTVGGRIVDERGCSQDQFCNLQKRRVQCIDADFLSDELLPFKPPRDCDFVREIELCISLGEEGGGDTDSDGVTDDSDGCLGTSPDVITVDDRGCSQEQFCNNIKRRRQCRTADFMEDERVVRFPLDCNFEGKCISTEKVEDEDGDGIVDNNDFCPNTIDINIVDGQGCSQQQFCLQQTRKHQCGDADFLDDEGRLGDPDDCAWTGSQDICESKDTPEDLDNDGIPNQQDLCPLTAPFERVDENGCAANQLDQDGDGVSDAADVCFQTEPGMEVDEAGCSQAQFCLLKDTRLQCLNANFMDKRLSIIPGRDCRWRRLGSLLGECRENIRRSNSADQAQ